MPLDRLFGSIMKDRLWSCPTCGQIYKEGRQCPREDEHWEDFTSTLRGALAAPASRRPAA